MGKRMINDQVGDENYKRLASAVIEQAISDLKEISRKITKLNKLIKTTQNKALAETNNTLVSKYENEVNELKFQVEKEEAKYKTIMNFFKDGFFVTLCDVIGVEPNVIRNGIKKKIAI